MKIDGKYNRYDTVYGSNISEYDASKRDVEFCLLGKSKRTGAYITELVGPKADSINEVGIVRWKYVVPAPETFRYMKGCGEVMKELMARGFIAVGGGFVSSDPTNQTIFHNQYWVHCGKKVDDVEAIKNIPEWLIEER